MSLLVVPSAKRKNTLVVGFSHLGLVKRGIQLLKGHLGNGNTAKMVILANSKNS